MFTHELIFVIKFIQKKSGIWETPTLSTNADIRTNTNFKRLHDLIFFLFFFAGPKGGRPTPGFSIFIRTSVRPYVRTYVRTSLRSNFGPYTFIKGQRDNTETKGQYRNKGTTKGQQRDNKGPKEQRNKGTKEQRNTGTKEQRNKGTTEQRIKGKREHGNKGT